LVGREHDVESARREILAGDGRLLTLIGPPGVGKTRLALEVVAGLTDRFEHGVTFVDLAPIREVHLVAPAMTRALGIWETGRGSAQSTLEAYLRARRALLLLDNFEQVVDAAPIISELLAACPRLVLIVTSRSALRVRWERVLPVAPLPLPSGYPEAGAVDLGENPAVALFVARARSIRPDFALTDQNRRDVAAICIRLDGLPLAIELAAGLARLLPPRTIAERLGGQRGARAALSSSLGLLTSGPRDLPLRQRTLRAALTWSYDLLDSTGQAAFRRLATFAGSFSLEAAASAVGEEIHADAAVATLIDHSLVRREPIDDGTPRFRILQTLREYGLEQLGSSVEANETWRRQAQFFIEMMARAERQHADQWGHEQAAWLQLVETDLDNIRAVLEWCASPDGDLEAGLILAGNTCRFWDMRGYFGEGRTRLGALIARADTIPGPRSTAEATRGETYTTLAAGFLAFAQGDFARSTAYVYRAMPLARSIDFTFGLTTGLVGLASMAYLRGAHDEAWGLLDEAEALSRSAGDDRSLYHTLYWQGEVARAAGQYVRAVRLLEECLNLTRPHGNPWLVGTTLFSLGHVALMQGDPMRATRLFVESLELRRPNGDLMGTAQCVEGLAWVATAAGRFEAAAQVFGAAESLRERIGASVEVGWTSDHQRFLEQTSRALDAATFAERWSAGRALGADEAVELGLRIEPPHPPGHAPDERALSGPALTPRERQTVELIALGYTNRQIAEQLVISPGAAANYVQRILEKLGFHARAQVAAWAVERGMAANRRRE
jgi:non-specific serine/threonine protein kinase